MAKKRKKVGRLPQQFCPKGHDTFVTGRTNGSRSCIACAIERRKNIINNIHKIEHKKRFCINNHDTWICGRDKYSNCRDCQKERRIIKKRKNKVAIKQYYRQYYINNKKELQRYLREYKHMRNSTDISFKLRDALRSRIRQAIKVGSPVRDLGCTIEFLIAYLQSKFYGNMSWDNWGPYWELDHIEELHTFDLTDRKQFLKAVHYTNLQPLTVEDHQRKTSKNKKLFSNRNKKK